MRKSDTLGFAALAIVALITSVSRADLTTITWNGATGTQSWQTAGNWVGGVVPGGTLVTADLSVPLASNLDVTLDSEVTIATISMGSTSTGVATSISGSRLVFSNTDTSIIIEGNDADFNNDGMVDGRDFLIWQRGFNKTDPSNNINGMGDANNDHVVNAADLTIWKAQYGLGSDINNVGFGFIESTGAVGVTNTVNSPIHLLNEQLEIGGTRNLTITGNLTYDPDMDTSVSNAGIRVLSPGVKVDYNGTITVANNDALDSIDFLINTHIESQGTLAINGNLTGEGTILIGTPDNGARLPLGTVELNGAKSFTGGMRAGRGNLVLNNSASLGTGSYRQVGPANQYGYNLISAVPNLVIPNDVTFAQWQTIKGENSIEFSGEIEQTNNRGVINLLPEGETLKFSGRLNIWEDEEEIERQFVIDGTGRTLLTGEIKDDPLDASTIEPLRRIVKNGTGSLLIDVPAGNNNHHGADIVQMGNFHYANNDSLNAHLEASILAIGGAIGVDTGVAGNSAFLSQIDPESRGGLMLASSDANAALDFTTGDLANAADMSVAAPEAGLTYTGTITPAGSTYKLGGGTGTLTLPNAQLSGANSLVVKNGGVVRLNGDNTYTGSTTVITKYSSTAQNQAAADATNQANSVFYDTLISPVLEVDDLANGGQASSIGAASSNAENILLQGATLRYVGTGDTTDRLFTVGTGGGTIESSGTGAVVFSNAGSVGMRDVQDHTGSILEAGPGNPNELYDLNDTSDVIVGMTVSDPDPGGTIVFTCPNGNCIPAGTTVTGISDDGSTIGLSQNVGFVLKENTRLVFGPVERTLTLAGTNAGDNTIASVIADSAGGSIVNIEKTGPGKWILSGDNTYTGDTIIEEGILSITNAFLSDSADVLISSGATLNLNFAGSDVIDDLFLGGSAVQNGTWGRVGHPTAQFKSAFLTGDGLLNVGGVALGALATAVPEPSAMVLSVLALLGFGGRRRHPSF